MEFNSHKAGKVTSLVNLNEEPEPVVNLKNSSNQIKTSKIKLLIKETLYNSKFKTNTIEKIKEIYEASCFKMDPIFVLEFDRKTYYEELNKKKQLQTETNNSND